MTLKNHIWAEKYRPTSLTTYVGNEQLKAKLDQFLTNQNIPHLLFVGPAGTGKTTAAKILFNNIKCDVLALNGSDENNIDTVRSKIKGFASTIASEEDYIKIVFLDEFDGFTRQGQEGLRNVMEQYAGVTRFILTANYLEKVSAPIQSRCQIFQIEPPSKSEVAKIIMNILKAEEVQFSLPDLKVIIDAHFPDIRHIIETCSQQTINKVLKLDQQALVESDFTLKIIQLLSTKSDLKTTFTEIRQLLVNNKVRDFISLYRLLFDRVEHYAPKNIPESILVIAEGQYRSSSVVDQEINFMSTIIQLLQVGT